MNKEIFGLLGRLSTLEAQSKDLINKLKEQEINSEFIDVLSTIHKELNKSRNDIKNIIDLGKNKGLP